MIRVRLYLLVVWGLLCSLGIHAQKFSYEGLNYEVLSSTDKTVTVSQNPEAAGDIVIPNAVFYEGDSLLVKSIGHAAFYGCRHLESVSASVEEIGNEAFRLCLGLKSISLDKVQTIASCAFYDCSSLVSITLPNLVTLGNSAFKRCGSLKEVVLENVETIGSEAFNACSKLEKVVVSVKVPSITYSTFVSNPIVYVPAGTKDKYLESGWKGQATLREYDFRAGNRFLAMNSITENTVSLVGLLEDHIDQVMVPDSVDYKGRKYAITQIGARAFYGCKDLRRIDFGKVELVGEEAFAFCSNLDSIDFKEVKTISKRAFASCPQLTALALKKVKTIQDNAFEYCSGLVSVDAQNASLIGNSAFANCKELTDVRLITDRSVEGNTIGDRAFQNCLKLSFVNLRDIEKIGKEAFYGCDGLTYLDLTSAEYIGDEAFNKSDNILGVKAPYLYSEIGIHLFSSNPGLLVARNRRFYYERANWRDFTYLVDYDFIEGDFCCSIAEDNRDASGVITHFGHLDSGHLVIPAEGATDYRQYPILVVGTSAFQNRTDVKFFDSNRVKVIQKEAFSGCSHLTSLDLREVENIYSDAFKDCHAIRKITVRTQNPPQVKEETCFATSVYLNAEVYVPKGCAPAYRNDPIWKSFKIEEFQDLDSIGYTFYLKGNEGGTIVYGTDKVVNSTQKKFVEKGEVVSLQVIPDLYYAIKSCKVNGVEVALNNGVYSFTMEQETTVEVEFARIEYTLSVRSNAGGTVRLGDAQEEVGETQKVKAGEVVSLHVTPDPDYEIKSCQVNGVEVALEDGICSFVMEQETTVEVVFARMVYALSVTSGSGGTVSIGDQEVSGKIDSVIHSGETLPLAVTPSPDFAIEHIWVNGEDIHQNEVFEYSIMVEQETQIVVTFKRIALNIVDGSDNYTDSQSSQLKELTYTRTFPEAQWEALYLPFEVDHTYWQENFEIAEVNNVHQFDIDQDGLYEKTLIEIRHLRGGKVKANRPYLIRAKSAGTYTLHLKDVVLEAAETASVDCSSVNLLYTFTGTYQEIDDKEVVQQHLYTIGEDGQLKVNAKSIGAFRWYLTITPRSEEPQILPETIKFVETDELTGIDKISQESTFNVYDLKGRLVKVQSKDLKGLSPGIYLIKGRKVIIK